MADLPLSARLINEGFLTREGRSEMGMDETAELLLEAAAELDRREARLTPCTWTEDEDGNCDTGCGHVFTLISDPPHDWVKFCCYCGHPVIVAALKG